MKKLKRIFAALTLAATLMCLVPTAYASGYDTIKVTSKTDYDLNYAKTATFSKLKGTYTKSSKTYNENAYVVTAKKGAGVLAVGDGSYAYGKNTVGQIANSFDKQSKRVMAAINGDFFSTQTGLPLGVQIENGKIIATNSASYDKESGRTSIGIKQDGSIIFGVPELSISVNIDGYSVAVDRINAIPDWYHVVLLTADYGAKTTWNTEKYYDIIVLKADEELTVGEDVTLHFDSFITNTNVPVKIEKGKVYLIGETGKFAGFTPPREVVPDTDTTVDSENRDIKGTGGAPVYDDISYVSVVDKTGKWADCVYAVGAGNLLVNNGIIRYPSTYDSAIKNTFTSRSAFGVKADGSYVFYAVERNNSAGSTGVWMDAVAQAMYDMGCVYAVNLDGGGSTTMLANTGSGLKLQNKCQDGSQRSVSNALLLLCEETAPVVVEDFEELNIFNDIFPDVNLMTARIDTDNVYTGAQALALDYSLSGIGKSVSVEFEPIDIKAHNTLMMAIDTKSSGITVEARLQTDEGIFTRPITDKSTEGYARYELDVSDADALTGFTLTYKLAAKNRNTVYIDRIVGYSGYSMKDVSAPTVTTALSGNTLKVSATEPAFSAGVDPQGAEVSINGDAAVRGNTVDLSMAPTDKINRAKTYVYDTVGNRAIKYNLFKADGFNKRMPFVDMTDTKWDALAIRYCNENGIISGFNENGKFYFKGSENVTRAQFCVMIVSQKKLDVNKYVGIKLPYEDLGDIPAWALLYIKAAYAEGIMTGTNTQTGVCFYPNNNITRAEAASALSRLITIDSRLAMNVTYKDDKDIAKWAKTAVVTASGQGLFEGDKDGKFYPQRNLTRSESAVLMSKL